MKQKYFRIIKNKGRLILAVSAVLSMLFLLIIQVDWLMESIKMQETIFTKGVNMALKQTALSMANDEQLNTAMQNSIDKDSLINSGEVFTQEIITRLDSTIQKQLELYHINLDFHFLLINGEDTLSLDNSTRIKSSELFQQSFDSPFPDSSIDLAIHFPGRSTFLLKRIGIMFISSVLLIIFTIVTIFIILAYYRKERVFAQQVKDMIGNLTHEFMTPISSISLAGNLILNRSQKLGDQAISQFANVIKEENTKLQKQVDRLLQLAAVENAGFKYIKKVIDVHQLILEVAQSMAFHIKQAEAEITFELRAEDAQLFADPLHMADVFRNLISNSIKYATQKPEIKISSESRNKQIILLFSDNGVGIPSREFKKIFEKYYRISSGDMHNTKGFGVGLYYAKTVVVAHRGTISVKSEHEKGSTFTITLPTNE